MRVTSKITGVVRVSVDLDYAFTYSGETKGKPLLIHLHGAGERGSLFAAQQSCISNWMPKEFKDQFCVASPSCEDHAIWNPHHIAFLADHIVKEFELDSKRIYLTGYSMGGRGTWDTATEYPNKFAAICPIAGYSCYLKAKRIAKLPTLILHGDQDHIVPVIESIKMYEEMRKYGGKPILHLLEGFGHEGWYGLYRSEEFYNWLLKHKKGMNESKLVPADV